METYIKIIKKLQQKEISLFTLTDFARIFNINNQNTLYKKIQRLEKKDIIRKLIKGRYLFTFKKPNEYKIANFLYQPSYISLESALSFYGIITAFPYQISSITIKKTKLYAFDNKSFSYSQIAKSLFWGYEKKENFLIAVKEKALLDYLYLVFKGQRILHKKSLDLSEIDKKKLKNYFKIIKNKQFLKFLTSFNKV